MKVSLTALVVLISASVFAQSKDESNLQKLSAKIFRWEVQGKLDSLANTLADRLVVLPDLLLKFEERVKGSSSRPGHSNPRIDFIEGGKNWPVATTSWRRKVRAYFNSIGKIFQALTRCNSY